MAIELVSKLMGGIGEEVNPVSDMGVELGKIPAPILKLEPLRAIC